MIERRIIIGLIASSEFCRYVHSLWNVQLLESGTAKRIALWCWEYFEKYDRAPGRDIEAIYYQKIKDPHFPKEIAEEFEQEILPKLSTEYDSETFNLKALTDDTNKYFAERHVTLHQEAVANLLAAGRTEDAQKLITEFKPLTVAISNLDSYILSVRKIRANKHPQPLRLITPWLRAGQITIIYGNYGCGKSLLTILTAYMLGLEDADNMPELSTWQVKHSTGTLYVDGELGEQEMEERVGQFEWIGKQAVKHRMQILSIPEYQMATEDPFHLSLRVNQLKVIKWLKDNPNYKLIVLDSVSTLFGIKDENDNSEWNEKINPFLRDLRALGVACILLHHSGKDGKRGLRGASAMGAMAHNIFKLTIHPSKKIEDGEAWFTLFKDKQRAAGFSFRELTLRFYQSDDGKGTKWETTAKE